MSKTIHVSINGNTQKYGLVSRHPFIVKEVDLIQIRVYVEAQDDVPEIYFEDYRAEWIEGVEDGAFYYETPPAYYFAECFGYANVRIEFPNDTQVLTFDILAKKTSVEQARKMIQYLSTHSASIVQSCFARTSHAVGSIRGETVEPEALLATAESFMEQMQSSQAELLHRLRKRLVPKRVPIWHTDMVSCDVDPSDVLNQLDALMPSSSDGDVILRNRYYDLSGIHVSQLQATADVQENRILLGGLYSIRRQITHLLAQLKEFETGDSDTMSDYESFSRLMLSLTAGGMIRRCQTVLQRAESFMRLFERKLDVTFEGEISPLMTGYVRSTRIYRVLFTHLHTWYQLGTPSMGGINFLMKMKSLSKIYELYVLFHLLEQFIKNGWEIESATPHPTMGDYIPSSINLKHGSDQLTLQYEPVIRTLGNDTTHMDLVDVWHNTSSSYPYWMPDFVLRFDSGGTSRYLILDAKYSTRNKVKEHHLPDLFEKYYLGMAVLDENNQTLTSAPIVGVFAIYALDQQMATYLPKWRRQGLSASPLRLPMVGGIGLMIDNSKLFNESLTSVMSMIRRTSPPVDLSSRVSMNSSD